MDEGDPLRISEVLRDNRISAADSDGDRPEWAELYNHSDQPVELKGYYLSDDPYNLMKWALPEGTLKAGEYLLVFLSGKDRTGAELHASFGLGDDEPTLYLTCLNGLKTDALEVPADLPQGISAGRDAGGNLRYYAQPTPGYENGYGFESADAIGFFNKDGVYITEVMAAHEPKSGENDWVELYNGGTEDVDLSGWFLSDDEDEPEKLTLENLILAPGDYAVIEATGNSARQKEGVGAFGISQAGETLVLTDAKGNLVDAFETGALRANVTAGRVEGDPSIRRMYFSKPTRGKANDVSSLSSGYTPTPVLSENGLYHQESFFVEITVRNENGVIYYTTDGSEPNSRSKEYTGPIQIKKNTVLRAAAYAPGLLKSEVATATYLFETPHTLPVVSLVGDPEDMDTVYATTDRENKPERAAYVQYFEADGSLGTQFPVGLKAKGASTLKFAQKSFSLHLRGGYGQSSVTYPFYQDYGYPYTTFTALALRNSGQDHDFTRLNNSFFTRATQGMYIDAAMTRPVVLYLNGRYWGIYDFDEDLNKDYLANHYGVDPEKVDIVRRNQTALAGSAKDFLAVRKLGKEGNTRDDAVFAEFSKRVDVAYFTDYFIAQTYFHNFDMFNQKYWRSQDGSVKWRPVCFDQDYLLNSYKNDMLAYFFMEDGVPSPNGTTSNMDVYIGLKKNRAWRDYCAERYVELICTQFNSERLIGILDEMAQELRPEMERHIKRWKAISSLSKWEKNLDSLRTALKRRPEIVLDQVQDFFDLSNAEMEELIQKYTPAAEVNP